MKRRRKRRKPWPALALLMSGQKCLRLKTKEAPLTRSDWLTHGAEQRTALVSRPVPQNLTKGPLQLEAMDTNDSLNKVAIMASPIQVPLELVKDKDGLLAKDKDGFPTKVVRLS